MQGNTASFVHFLYVLLILLIEQLSPGHNLLTWIYTNPTIDK